MIGLKNKKETNIEKKETYVDNRGFGFLVKISTNFFLYCTWSIKHLYFFEKNQRCNLYFPT